MFGADLHQPNVDRAAQELGVIPTALNDILFVDCDIVAPCALGAILNAETIPQLKAKVVAGAANNQLASEVDDARLQDLGILYCPDFAINAGGVIDIYHQGLKTDPIRRTAAIDKIGVTIASIIDRALRSDVPTQQAAIAMVNEKLAASGKAAISEMKLRQIA